MIKPWIGLEWNGLEAEEEEVEVEVEVWFQLEEYLNSTNQSALPFE